MTPDLYCAAVLLSALCLAVGYARAFLPRGVTP